LFCITGSSELTEVEVGKREVGGHIHAAIHTHGTLVISLQAI
jgi:hypothetical protein